MAEFRKVEMGNERVILDAVKKEYTIITERASDGASGYWRGAVYLLLYRGRNEVCFYPDHGYIEKRNFVLERKYEGVFIIKVMH